MLLLDTLERKLPHAHVVDAAVSKATVGWHIHHCCLMINVITKALKKSNPSEYKWKPSALRTVILNLGVFPRGRAQAPEAVQPKGTLTRDVLETELFLARASADELNTLPKNSFFKHPIFGNLNVKPGKTFLRVHTKHHLKIIDDILRSAG